MQALVIHPPHDLRVESHPAPDAALPPKHVHIRMAAGGICGSDLHYYHHGGFGTVRIREPMVLGHEAAGFITALGEGVTGLNVGDLVAVNPSSPCGDCAYCANGQENHCENMQFNGSAMRFPHVQGLFQAEMVVPAARAFPVDPAISPAEAALSEPFAVALHAAAQAGSLEGKTVLVSGCGPIGVLMVVVARLRGAKTVIATDVTAHSLAVAAQFGAAPCLDLRHSPDALAPHQVGKGQVDVVFECSGNPAALAGAIACLRPQGRMVLVGLGGDVSLPLNTLVAKEITLVGTFRFKSEFAEAARLISTRKVDLRPMLSASFPLEQAEIAFRLASDRTQATKVSLLLG
jgi:L-idonate 5-dehydrogenase